MPIPAPYVFGNSFDSVQGAAAGYDALNFQIAESNRRAQQQAQADQQARYNFMAQQQAEQQQQQARMMERQQENQQALSDAQLSRNNQAYQFGVGEADKARDDARRTTEFDQTMQFNRDAAEVRKSETASKDFGSFLNFVNSGVTPEADKLTELFPSMTETEKKQAQAVLDAKNADKEMAYKQSVANAKGLNLQLDAIKTAAKGVPLTPQAIAPLFKQKHPGVEYDEDTQTFVPILARPKSMAIDNPQAKRLAVGLQHLMPNQLSAAIAGDVVPLAPADQFDTKLSPADEAAFQQWRQQYAPRQSGADYDLRGAFKAGLKPSPVNGHWRDTFKKPNHTTFSNESMYAQGDYATNAPMAGSWNGDTFIPPTPPVGGASGEWTPDAPPRFNFNPDVQTAAVPVAAPVVSTNDMVRVKSPTGQGGMIPRSKLQLAIQRGYTVAQ